jgi:hypothetical protein
MEIIWKDYKITVNRYSWDLHKRHAMTQEKIDNVKRMGGKTKKKIGDYTWTDEGFFHNLDTMVNKIIRMEAENEPGTIQLSDYLIRWNNIIQNFTQQCEVIKKEG